MATLVVHISMEHGHCFKSLTWQAMMFVKSELDHIQFETSNQRYKDVICRRSCSRSGNIGYVYYEDSVTVTKKGQEMELVKILTIFTSIDLSSNSFEGPIPAVVGDFKSLIALNLSHNALSGEIPSVVGNLAQLEALDLSNNYLVGAIPTELARLNSLSFLNLSRNLLVGMIPPGAQLQTFGESSFQDNLALCGSLLKVKCTNPKSLPTETEEDLGEGLGSEIGWEFWYGGVLGFGFGGGMVIGALFFTNKGRKWGHNLADHIHFGILHPSWFIYTLLLVFIDTP